MYFGSKYVYNYSEEEEEEFDEDDIQGALDSDDESKTRADKHLAKKKRRKWRKADTNVVCVKFDKLTSANDMHTGDPVYCTGCGATVSSISKVTQQVWICEFCNTSNTVDVTSDEVPKKDDVTFMLQPSETSAATTGVDKKTISGDAGSLVIFCVDVSGSMSTDSRVPGRVDLGGGAQNRYQESRNITLVSRLDAVKVAVIRQLQEIADTSSDTRVALVTFATQVRAVGDGSCDNPLTFHGGQKTEDEIKTLGVGIPLPMAVSRSKSQLTDKVCDMHTQDTTALGPALLLSVAMASQVRGSKVIICTDGMANVGLGNLSSYSRGGVQYDEATEFYNDTARYASENGVSISVITFEGTDCRLAELGHVAAITEGHVNIVDPMKLTEEFGNILIDRTVATNVTATFLLHQGLYIRNEDNVESKVVKEFGNVSKDTEITFEYGIRRKKKKPIADTPKSDTSAKTETPTDPNDPTAATGEQADTSKTTTETTESSKPVDTDETTADTATQAAATSAADSEVAATDPAGQTSPDPAGQTSPDPAGQASHDAAGQAASTDNQAGTSTATESPGRASVDDLSELPFQLQVVYTDMEGNKAIRVLTQKKPVTKERQKAETNMKANVMLTHGTKMNHALAMQGQYKESRMNANTFAHIMKRNVTDAPKVQAAYADYIYANQSTYSDVQHFESHERLQYGRTLSDSEGSDDDDQVAAGGAVLAKSKKKKVVHGRQQMRHDKASKNLFSKMKQAFMGPKNDSESDDDKE